MRHPMLIMRLVVAGFGVGASFLSALVMLGVLLESGFLKSIEKNVAAPLDYGMYGSYLVGFFVSLYAGCFFLERLLDICAEFDRG